MPAENKCHSLTLHHKLSPNSNSARPSWQSSLRNNDRSSCYGVRGCLLPCLRPHVLDTACIHCWEQRKPIQLRPSLVPSLPFGLLLFCPKPPYPHPKTTDGIAPRAIACTNTVLGHFAQFLVIFGHFSPKNDPKTDFSLVFQNFNEAN